MAKAIVLTLWGVMPTANRLIAISVCNLLCRKTLQSKISDAFRAHFSYLILNLSNAWLFGDMVSMSPDKLNPAT
jgi:hypothetical protein